MLCRITTITKVETAIIASIPVCLPHIELPTLPRHMSLTPVSVLLQN